MKIQDEQGEKLIACNKCHSTDVERKTWMMPNMPGSYDLNMTMAKHGLNNITTIVCKKCGNSMRDN